MNVTDYYDIFDFVRGQSTTTTGDIIEKLYSYCDAEKEIERMKEFLYSDSQDYMSGGQGRVFHSLTDYFKKDRETRLIFSRYPVHRNYTKFTRRTVRATKQPVRMAGWKGRR